MKKILVLLLICVGSFIPATAESDHTIDMICTWYLETCLTNGDLLGQPEDDTIEFCWHAYQDCKDKWFRDPQ